MADITRILEAVQQGDSTAVGRQRRNLTFSDPNKPRKLLKPAQFQVNRLAGNPPGWQTAGVCAFLALAVLAVFGQTAGFDFVNYDDVAYVYENPKLAGGLSLDGVAWAFTHAECFLYHPLTMISLRLDYQLHGLHAGGYHLTNVLLHAASAILLFLLLR